MNSRRDRLSVIFITIAAAVVLTLLPLPPLLDMMRPYWVALVIIYWCLETQDLIPLGMAFTIGITLDLLSASLLGLHALSLVIIVYLVTRFRARLRFFPPWQQALSVLEQIPSMSPSYADGIAWYGDALIHNGRPAEGLASVDRAVELTPNGRVLGDFQPR